MSPTAPHEPLRRPLALPLCVLTLTMAAVYSRTFTSPLVFDDAVSITANPTIRRLWPPAPMLASPAELGSPVSGRPLLNISFALNYAISGTSVWSYHATNLAIHVGAALLLFGIIRRILDRARRRGDSTSDGVWVAFVIAAAWGLHPLETEAVTYVSQRAESLASFWYLLAVYAFVRAAGSDAARKSPWLATSVVACLLGALTKEIVATAPVLILLADAAFISGSVAAAWRTRRGYYLALAVAWPLIGVLAFATANRGGTAGFGVGVSTWEYLLTQAPAITRYLRLTFWPYGQVFDYGTGLTPRFVDVWPYALFVGALLSTSIVCFGARTGARLRGVLRVAGFLGLAFFLLLAPSSSVVPIQSQTIAEHRMYLPLAPLLGLAVVAVNRWLGRRGVLLLLLPVAADGVLAFQRNELYRSDLALWSDTVRHAANNARAHDNLGVAFASRGRLAEALAQFEVAAKLQPDYADAQANLAHVLVLVGRAAEALPHAELAVKLNPRSPDFWNTDGLALTRNGRLPEAIGAFQRALKLEPASGDTRFDLGNVYYQLGDYPTAATNYELALRTQPTRRDARFNLAYTFLLRGQPQEALKEYERLVQQDPNDARSQVEAGNILADSGRPSEAIAHFEAALRVRPDLTAAREQLARLRATKAVPGSR